MSNAAAKTTSPQTNRAADASSPLPEFNHRHIDVRWWSWEEALAECWRLGIRISMSRLRRMALKGKSFRYGKGAKAPSRLYPVDRRSMQKSGQVIPWVPNHMDILETDWMVAE